MSTDRNPNYDAQSIELIRALRDRILATRHDLSRMQKYDFERSNLEVQKAIEELICRPLTDQEIADLEN